MTAGDPDAVLPADAVAEADAAQAIASDPRLSVWVGASAGTGKTTVLTRRVLRLMLDGAAPGRILCLTFTKAAAAEMRNRISVRIAHWAALPQRELDADLTKLTGAAPTREQRLRARRLFATVLDVPGGLKIQTIHAFCQSVLRRFPLEAGIPPHFEVMDERSADETLLEAREALLREAQVGGAGAAEDTLSEALETVTGEVGEEGFSALMALMAGERGRLKRLQAALGDVDQVAADLAARLGLAPGETAADILASACADRSFDGPGLRHVVQAGLLAGSKSDQARGETIAGWLALDEYGRVRGFDSYVGAYLTKTTADIAKKLATNAALKGAPETLDVLQAEAERVLAVMERLRAAGLAAITTALLRLAFALLDHYERRKAARALLDYDDLILATERLLQKGADWVLFKLDGGLDHVLIDEAQDTNPDQWSIVEALVTEFFVGAGARDLHRTLFAVGDVKQSIYSFQRADPHAFTAVRDRFRDRITVAEPDGWADVPMQTSFRSTDAVLQAVDAVFARGAARAGVALEGRSVQHASSRAGHAGRVEVWPILAPADDAERSPWQSAATPVEQASVPSSGADPEAMLAGAIAHQVRAWIDDGELLESRARPIRPGDVMVLVRRRTRFVEELVRQLKALDLPVAGVDRMVLTDQLAVMDLLAFAGFLLLPRDDLTLATVLKGPFVGLDEDRLMAVAAGREGQPLWDRLRAMRGTDPQFERAASFLEAQLARADFAPPFELFADLLAAEVPLGPSGRAALIGRLGVQAEDPLEEFMALALAYQRSHTPSLQGFLQWVSVSEAEVKRDLDQAIRDEVRVMTVHGAKGLQAPIVFLPDTTSTPKTDRKLFWLSEEGDGTGRSTLPLWSPRKASDDPVAAACRESERDAQMQEYARLLYVAMTRAEDRLYVCGWVGRRKPSVDCWHQMVSEGLAGLAEPLAAESVPSLTGLPVFGSETEAGFEGLRFALSQRRSPEPDSGPRDEAAPDEQRPPDWAFRLPPEEPEPSRPLAPSVPTVAEPAVRSPLQQAADGDRFRRGLLIHRLLQSLPELPPDARRESADRWLASPAHGLDAASRQEILEETLSVLAEPDFSALFGPGSRAEVPVTGLIGRRDAGLGLVPQVVSGQIDRMLVADDRVTIIDFKTLRPPPTDPVNVSAAYLRQMAAYRALIGAIYPDRAVSCALLWTDGPRIMALPDALLARQGFESLA